MEYPTPASGHGLVLKKKLHKLLGGEIAKESLMSCSVSNIVLEINKMGVRGAEKNHSRQFWVKFEIYCWIIWSVSSCFLSVPGWNWLVKGVLEAKEGSHMWPGGQRDPNQSRQGILQENPLPLPETLPQSKLQKPQNVYRTGILAVFSQNLFTTSKVARAKTYFLLLLLLRMPSFL